MARMAGSVSVGANSTSSQQLSGKLHEIGQYPRAAIRVAATTSATGVNGQFSIDSRQVAQNELITFANRFPILGQDDFVSDVAYRMQRLFLTFTNTTAGSLTVNWLVDVVPF